MGAHARQLSRLRLKSFSMVKPEINGEVGPFWQYRTVLQANFKPLALVTYARYDPAVKNKHSIHVYRTYIINATGWKLASVTVCAARMAQLRHRFPAYLCINF